MMSDAGCIFMIVTLAATAALFTAGVMEQKQGEIRQESIRREHELLRRIEDLKDRLKQYGEDAEDEE